MPYVAPISKNKRSSWEIFYSFFGGGGEYGKSSYVKRKVAKQCDKIKKS